MRLAHVAIFAAGYVMGARAGRERYAQIVAEVARTSRKLEAFSARHPPGRQDYRSDLAYGGSGSVKTPL